MDRLLCGDVGYGKTEVALRAAFKGYYGWKASIYFCSYYYIKPNNIIILVFKDLKIFLLRLIYSHVLGIQQNKKRQLKV